MYYFGPPHFFDVNNDYSRGKSMTGRRAARAPYISG